MGCLHRGAFAVVFVSATIAVRALIAHSTRSAGGPRRLVAAAVVVLLFLALAACAAYRVVASAAMWAAAPADVVALVLVVSMPSARHLRRIGWTLVGAVAAGAVVLIVALR